MGIMEFDQYVVSIYAQIFKIWNIPGETSLKLVMELGDVMMLQQKESPFAPYATVTKKFKEA